MSRSGVFVSYRRTDGGYALLFYKALTQKFGSARVFRDFEDIQPGQDFVVALDDALSRCAACVVIIGKGWLDALDRLSNPEDFVHREIATILKRGTLLIPCLVGGSRMPLGTAMPEPLADLVRKDAITIGDEYFDRDFDVLLDSLDRALSAVPQAVGSPDDVAYRQQRAVELLKRLVFRLQTRAVELVQNNEVARARDELSDGFDVIMQLLEWSPSDVPLDLQLGYLLKTQAQVQDAAGQREEANRSLELAFAMFNRLRDDSGGASEKASAFNGLGNVFFARGDLDAAMRNYRRAVELMPDYAYAWHDLLLVYLQQAEAGSVDLAAMEHALGRVKTTGAGLPGLGVAHLLQLEAMVAQWRGDGVQQPAKKIVRDGKARSRKMKKAGRKT